jgi:iron complex outermembrane receptor protein
MQIISRRAISAMLSSTSLCACALLSPISYAHAQDATVLSPGQSSDTSTAAGEMNDIVVTAQRRSELARDVPISVTAQSGDDLARQGVSNIQDLSIAVPGLSFTKLGAWAQPTIRGVQTSVSAGGADASVAIYLDGVYRPNQVANVFELPDVERVEVLKGPQGTLFGRNATGGAILVHTLEPSLNETFGRLSISDGLYLGDNVKTANEITVKAFASTPITDKLAISASGLFIHNPGFMTDDVSGDRYGRQRTYMVRGKLRFEPTERLRFLLSAMYGETKDDSATSFFPLDGVTVGSQYPGAIVPTKPWHFASELKDGSTIRMKEWGASLRAELDVGDAGTATSITAYSKATPVAVADVDGTFSPACRAVHACITPYVVEFGPQKTFQQELTFASRDFGMFSFIGGLFYYNDRHTTRLNVNTPLAPDGSVDIDVDGIFASSATTKTESYAAFGEVNIDFTDKLRIIAGARYSWEKKVGTGGFFNFPQSEFARGTWDAWTPRFSILYKLTPAINIYGTYSKGFKSGILDTPFLTPVTIDPETITSYEVGIKVGTRAFSASASAFYYDYKDLQVAVLRGVILSYGNAANARMYGFEVDTTTRLSETLQLRIGGSWLPHAEYRDFPGAVSYDLPLTPAGLTLNIFDASGTRMVRTPRLTATATLAYSGDIEWGHLDASGTLYYSSTYSHDFLQRVQTNSYVTINGRVSLTPAGSPFTFSIFGKNLTNKAFVDGSVPNSGADSVHFGNPRQVGVSVDYAF